MASDPFDAPLDRHYEGKHHLWAQRDQETGCVRVGIDALGLESLGELAYVSLDPVGTTVTRGESIGTLEAAKMTTSIAAPVSGTVTRRNEVVLRDPLLVNRDPYEGGWLVEIEPTDWDRDAKDLISGADIPSWVAAETERLQAETRD